MARRLGYPFAIASAVVSGASVVLGKVILQEGVAPLGLTALVSLGTAAILFPASPRLTLRRPDLPLVLAITALGGSTGPLLFYLGLGGLQAGGNPNAASVAALLVNTEVLFTILIALVVFRESGDRWEYLAIALLGAGALVVTTNLELEPRALLATASVDLFLIVSYLVWGVDNNLSRGLSERNNIFQLLWVKYAIGGTTLLIVALALGAIPVPRVQVLGLLALLAGIYAASTLTFYAALARIGAMRSIAFFATSAGFGPLYAFLLLGERVSPIQVAGALLMALGVVLIARREIARVEPSQISPATSIPGTASGESLVGEGGRRS